MRNRNRKIPVWKWFYTLNNLRKVSRGLLINAASVWGVTCVLTDCQTLIVGRPQCSARVHIITLNILHQDNISFIRGWIMWRGGGGSKTTQKYISHLSFRARTQKIFPLMLWKAVRSVAGSKRQTEVERWSKPFPALCNKCCFAPWWTEMARTSKGPGK